MIEDIEALIQNKETELVPFLSHMEELRLEFIKETVLFASEWYQKTAKQYVTKFSQVTLSMSEDRIAKMKSKINNLTRNAKTVVEEFDKPELWWHQKPTLNTSFDQYRQLEEKYPESLDRAVRHILGYLGVILEEYRYNVTISSNMGSYQEYWFDNTYDNNSSPTPYYPHLIKWSERMEKTIREYNSQFTQAITIYNEIQKLKEEKKKQQAMSRWDSI